MSTVTVPRSAAPTGQDAVGLLAMGGLAGASALWLVGLIAAMVVDREAMGATLVGGAVVIAWCFLGHMADAASLKHTNARGMIMILVSFAARALVLGLLVAWYWSHPTWRALIDPAWLAVGCLAAVVGWQAGFFVVHARARQPIYDAGYTPASDAEEQAQ